MKDKPSPDPPTDVSARGVPLLAVVLASAYLLVIPLAHGGLYWMSRASAGSELTQDRARFAVVNALTLTGFQASMGAATYGPAGRVIILLLTLFGAAFSLIVGGLAIVRILGLRYSDWQVVRAALGYCGLLTVAGAIPLIDAQRPLVESVMLSASAMANSGVYFGQLPGLMSWQTHLVLLPLAVLGSLGLPVVMEALDALRGRGRLSGHSRAVLGMTAWLYLIGLVIFLALHRMSGGAGGTADGGLAEAVASSSVASLNSRTLGLPFQFAQEFPRTMQWALMAWMAIGASPGGTGGGLKTTTVLQIVRGARQALRGESAGRPFGIALAWAGIYAAIVGVLLLLLMMMVPQLSADRLLFETISAVSNVGMSFEVVMIVRPGLDILAAGMLLGRLAPLAILWWMACTVRRAELAIG